MATTFVDLFRAGNAGGPRLDHVRLNRDILVHQRYGVVWVRSRSGGISSFANLKPWGGIWWRLPAGSLHSDLLLVYSDHSDHWVWEPAQDMELDRYTAMLAALNPQFTRV